MSEFLTFLSRSEQQMLALATPGVILVNGCIAHAGSPDEVRDHLVESYLGGA
jgi:ABC-type branched-subunit amino acid transport system ATPase component